MNYEYNMTKAELNQIVMTVKDLLNAKHNKQEIAEMLGLTEYDVAVVTKQFTKTKVFNYKTGKITVIYK